MCPFWFRNDSIYLHPVESFHNPLSKCNLLYLILNLGWDVNIRCLVVADPLFTTSLGGLCRGSGLVIFPMAIVCPLNVMLGHIVRSCCLRTRERSYLVTQSETTHLG